MHEIADTVGGDIRAGTIRFTCAFSSGANVVDPVVYGSKVEDAGQEW
jgi:hypothetical protein